MWYVIGTTKGLAVPRKWRYHDRGEAEGVARRMRLWLPAWVFEVIFED